MQMYAAMHFSTSQNDRGVQGLLHVHTPCMYMLCSIAHFSLSEIGRYVPTEAVTAIGYMWCTICSVAKPFKVSYVIVGRHRRSERVRLCYREPLYEPL